MKRLASFPLFVISICAVILSCSKEASPMLTMTGSRSFNFPNDGGTQSITFNCNKDWSVSSSEPWVKVSPSSGKASDGEITVKITCSANTTYDPRTATVTVRVEELSETISISQDTGIGLIVSPKTLDLTNAAQTIEIEVQKNVQYSITIDVAGKDWITHTGTKALSSEKATFSIAANETYDNREAKITFKQDNGSLSETVVVKQSQMDAISVAVTEYRVSNEAQSVNVEISANVEFNVSSEVEWVHFVETKALSASTVVLSIDANSTYYSREGQVKIIGKEGTVQEMILINQEQTNALFITSEDKEFKIPSKGGEVVLNVFHNIDFQVDYSSIPDWVSVASSVVDAYNTVLTFQISENTQYVGRNANIKVVGNSLYDTVMINQNQVCTLSVDNADVNTDWQENEITVIVERNVDYFLVLPEWIVEESKQSKTSGNLIVDTIVYHISENLGSEREGSIVLKWINENVESETKVQVHQSGFSVTVSEPGTLLDIIGTKRVPNITSVTINGYLNGTDVLIIRRMSSLVKLDIGDAHIRAGGKPYYVVDNYESYSTKDDIITSYMFGFKDNPVFNELILPKSITRIEERAFWMSPITKISDIPGTVYLEREAFYYSAIKSLVLGEGITTIEPMTFSMSGLLSITLPNSIVSIENGAFRFARSLREVNMPNAVEKIGNEAFCECPLSASSVTIPATVKELGYGIYRGCPKIKEIHIKAYPSTLTTIWGAIADTKTVTLYIPKGTYDEYYLTPLGAFETIIEE